MSLPIGFLLLLGASQAGDPTARTAPPAPVTVQVHIDLAKDRGPIPIEYVDNHVMFQAELGGERVWMLLDNGSAHNVIDAGLARRLGLPIVASAGTIRTPGGHDVPNRRVNDVALVVPHAFAGRMPMAAIDLTPMAHLGPGGQPVLGVLGHDITAHFGVTIDKRTGELILAPGRAVINGSVQPITVRTVDSNDQIDAAVDGKPLVLTLDLGSGEGVSLTPAAWAKVKPKNAQSFERKSMGISGVADLEIASRLPSLTLGDTQVRDVDVRVAPQLAGAGDGRIGMGLLSRFSLVLDTEHGKLWLIPVATDTSRLPPPAFSSAR